MQTDKTKFTHDVLRIIYDVCKMVFNLHSDRDVTIVFNLKSEELENIVATIVNSIPDKLLNGEHHNKQEEVKNICAKEFIFFQMQEKYNDPHYQEDLSNFIHIFVRDIKNRLEPAKEK